MVDATLLRPVWSPAFRRQRLCIHEGREILNPLDPRTPHRLKPDSEPATQRAYKLVKFLVAVGEIRYQETREQSISAFRGGHHVE
jgi:hypothetical protein